MSSVFQPGDRDYPAALAELPSPPTLYLRGALPAEPGVAIVGTRGATPEALRFTRGLVFDLAERGVAIWSGGAVGVDAAAHEAALEAGAPTVVVAGGGLDRPYPKDHVALYDRVLAAGGALVARVPDDVHASPAGFLARNTVLAALTVATVVVQAGLASGARSTAAAARRLRRRLCVVPHSPWDERGAGCALELTRGAVAIMSARDVLAALDRPLPPPPRPRNRRAPARVEAGAPSDFGRSRPRAGSEPASREVPEGLTTTEKALFEALGARPEHMDLLCEKTGLGPSSVTGALLTLTLAAVVVEGPAGFFRRASSFVEASVRNTGR